MPTVPYNKDLQAIELPRTRRPGQTGIYRRVGFENELMSIPPSRPHLRTVYDSFQHGLAISPNKPCLGERIWNPISKTYGPYEWQTYVEVAARATRFGSGLVHLYQLANGFAEPVPHGWTVGIWSINRARWTTTDIACVAYNLVSIGLYDTLGPEAVTYGINHSECSIVISSIDHIASLLRNAGNMPGLKSIISMDSLKEPAVSKAVPESALAGPILRTFAADKGVQLLDWDEVEALGQLHQRRHTPPRPEDIFTICYTSGTTGMPKGAIITHANLIATLASSEVANPLSADDCVISYLPAAHLYGRAMEVFLYGVGGQIGYSTGDALRLLDDIAALRPTFLPAVPRLLNRIYARVYAATAKAPGLAGVIARKGLSVKLANLEAGLGNKHALWDRLLFNKVRMALGGRVDKILTGSAPVAAEVLSFIRVAFIVDVLEAYGQTENSASATSTQREELEAGHVGPPSPNSEIKLVDVPELNYFSTDKPYPRGEICTRGPATIPGYLKDEKKTRETIDEEGWLHSGDIGFIKENGTLTVIDRVKNIFKLSIGEYVAVEKVENQIATRLPIALQLFIHGDSVEACLVAVVVPDPDTFPAFVNKVLGEGTAITNVIYQDPKLRRAVLKEIALAAQAASLKSFEIPKAVLIEPKPFTIEGGMLTPTLKIKRHPVVEAYRKQIDELYREIRSGADPKL
ncbi:hypothetical protein BG015_008823 [Linnemannia schmuckeri]|uniref:AMP-dependent synthetase/ligase domain-containing protein n=1 Tax=Linnemannia schmuckeri TaxID=64567 RepID=A0A9P5RWS9_9FUNG|nr:hypothetical protein BG015_008823 [Linnemannia schmuckeri]